MAIVYYVDGSEEKKITPVEGSMFWWYKNARVVLKLTVLKTGYTKEASTWSVTLKWDHYCGLVNTRDPEYTGDVTWNDREWDAANLMAYVEPMKEENLGPDEELCRSCNGTYFEMERDLDILRCIWCDKSRPGTNKKQPEATQPNKRSPFHPTVPNLPG